MSSLFNCAHAFIKFVSDSILLTVLKKFKLHKTAGVDKMGTPVNDNQLEASQRASEHCKVRLLNGTESIVPKKSPRFFYVTIVCGDTLWQK